MTAPAVVESPETGDPLGRLLAAGLPPEAVLELAALVFGRLAAGRPGPVELVVHVGPRRITGAAVREERHYPAPAVHLLGR